MNDRRYSMILGAILAASLAIRLYMVPAGLPCTYWHDENNYIEMALKLGTGDLKMASLSHGGAYQIALFIAYAAYYLISKVLGLLHSSVDIYLKYLKDPTIFFLIARTLSALAGAFVAWFVYLITAKSYDRRSALLAAMFAGLSLVMVQMSGLALADALSVFLLMGGFLCLVLSMGRRFDIRFFCIASLLVGLAAACKYLAVFGTVTLCTAAVIKSREEGARPISLIRYLLLAGFFVLAGFCIGMPFFIVNFPKFYNDTIVRMGSEYILRNPDKGTWLFYFTNHLKNALGSPLEIAALSGILYAFFRHTREDVLILSFPAAYYLFMMNSMSFAYHLMPAIPFILILAARFLSDSLKKFLPLSGVSICMMIGLALIAPSLSDSIKYACIMTASDTRTIARDWIEENVSEKDKILAEGYIFTLAVHTPPIAGNETTLRRDVEFIISRGGSAFSAKTELANYEAMRCGKRAYDIYKRDFINREDVLRADADYMILTGTNDSGAGREFSYYMSDDYFDERRAARALLSERFDLVKQFLPTKEFSGHFPHLVDSDYHILRSIGFSDLPGFIRGPRIEIFRFKAGRPAGIGNGKG